MANQTSKHTVMVVEDEVLLLQAISKKLEIEGICVVSCTNGAQAIDYLSSLPNLPDAIWLDYYLKDMNGLDFMHQLKNNSLWQHIPVVVVSNSAGEEKVHSMLALGAKKYLLKAEYKLTDIIKVIVELIQSPENASPKK